MSEEIEFHGWLVSEEIEFHGWLGKKKSAFFPPPGVFFWNSPKTVNLLYNIFVEIDHEIISTAILLPSADTEGLLSL